MFIPDYLGTNAWKLPMVNRDHFKIKPLLDSEPEYDYTTAVKKYHFPWIEMDVSYSWQTWLSKIIEQEKLFSNFETEYGKGWKYISVYSDKTWNENIIKNCPAMTSWLKDVFPNTVNLVKLHDIKIMALEPNGYSELQHNEVSGQINLALNNPTKCKVVMFYPNPMDKTKLKDYDYIGVVPFKEGSAIKLNTENYHMIQNLSDEVRYHITINADTEIDKKTKSFYDNSIKNTIGGIKNYARI